MTTQRANTHVQQTRLGRTGMNVSRIEGDPRTPSRQHRYRNQGRSQTVGRPASRARRECSADRHGCRRQSGAVDLSDSIIKSIAGGCPASAARHSYVHGDVEVRLCDRLASTVLMSVV
jgi:hypothetical protein